MPKFTVLLNQQAIKTETFLKGIVHIGREETNNIVLEGEEIAPAHTAIVIREQGHIIKQLNENFPIFVNEKQTSGCSLNDGDTIKLGGYSIIFSAVNDNEPDNKTPIIEGHGLPKNKRAEMDNKAKEGSLQIMEGEHIGRIIPLKKAMTRLGRTEAGGVVVISRRANGYFISSLDSDNTLSVNGIPAGDSTLPLKNNDMVTIDNVKMLFFA